MTFGGRAKDSTFAVSGLREESGWGRVHGGWVEVSISTSS